MPQITKSLTTVTVVKQTGPSTFIIGRVNTAGATTLQEIRIGVEPADLPAAVRPHEGLTLVAVLESRKGEPGRLSDFRRTGTKPQFISAFTSLN